VAVIGSGPAGLSAAYHLVEKGYRATVFEALPVAGGVLSVGIPESRLPRRIVQTEIHNLEQFGVEILLEQPLGPSGWRIEDLFDKGYGAVFLSTGIKRRRKMKFSGAPCSEVKIPHLPLRDKEEYGLGEKGKVLVDPKTMGTKKRGDVCRRGPGSRPFNGCTGPCPWWPGSGFHPSFFEGAARE
jgi:NADPH-dependent glutamate synthase beta subunit-like oxidoreductase